MHFVSETLQLLSMCERVYGLDLGVCITVCALNCMGLYIYVYVYLCAFVQLIH